MFASLAKPDEDIELHWLKVSLQLPFTRPGRRSPNSIAGHACGHTRSFREATSATERDALPWEMSQFASPPSVELRSRTCGIASGIGVLISVEPCEQPPTKITLSPGKIPRAIRISVTHLLPVRQRPPAARDAFLRSFSVVCCAVSPASIPFLRNMMLGMASAAMCR